MAYVERANAVVAAAVAHSDHPEAEYAILHPSGPRTGLCSQHAVVLAEILRRNGVESADAYQIDGHVVVAPYSAHWTGRASRDRVDRLRRPWWNGAGGRLCCSVSV